ncbi:hypothetical protein K461DRAFT_135054 [Myriangium duriaei CBS 260.36]|uniref:Transcriptional regulatory protein RXT2 N-terminal domain-containing protein n=1 Tax=Myriangium duriaei CBS 260.36 TaxID=1168546 RepID=A0A9P4J2X0_9PEZI|nr:hypothetical protein K461DRAFT_135054 [Myriangium duriaei CBS 260.36]
MASQQTHIAETIRGMKLALQRRDDESDSDTSIRQHTNRGNKLKRKAHHIRSGRLDTSGGQSYRKRINHAGYQRTIIHENPALCDFDGDPVDLDEDDDQENYSSVEDNPFGETKLEELLMPLTSAPALSDHPSLSVPYTAKHITEMAENVRQILHRERELLWKMKAYLQRFRGDELWAPLENLESAQDLLLLENDALDFFPEDKSVDTSASVPAISSAGSIDITFPLGAAAKLNGTTSNAQEVQTAQVNGVAATDMARHDTNHMNDVAPITNGTAQHADQPNGSPASPIDNQAEVDGDDAAPSHAMTTRAKARTPPPSDGATSPSPSSLGSVPSISAFFLPPANSLPDQSLGLPDKEAEDTRRLMLLYVQKQEEVVRGTERLLHGLLRADRARNEVWAWCRAEAHAGELSDGEDWYDKEHWGLEEDLVKGKEEEEQEDEGKRRGRRREAKGRNAAGAAAAGG